MFNQPFNMNSEATINNLYNQLNQLRAMQSQINSPIPSQPQPPTNGITQIGTYVVVKTLQDMENYGVPVDGTPVNIFIENSGVFYSKKLVNGVTSCQPFSFSPLNTSKTDEKSSPEQTPNEIPEWAELLTNRVEELYSRVESLSQSRKQPVISEVKHENRT